MLTFLWEHAFVVITCAYIAVGILVFWVSGEMHGIEDENTSLKRQGSRFSDKRFALYKGWVAVAGVIQWPFLLQARWRRKNPHRRPALEAQQEVIAKTSRDWHPGDTLLGEFAVERELGEGGMGKVYLVKSRTTKMRFAVKRAKGLKERERRNFLAELQAWIDLPEHPNLVACRFFRTVEDEVLIFAEYVAGGSLRNWIDSRKLYEGGAQKTLERLLDTAIQFAWALHCLHELGLVHQDVKPANLMIEKDAQACAQGLRVWLTDYGLVRARTAGGTCDPTKVNPSILVSSGGCTPAYCSPEQADGRKLDRRTDVWSWGVSVLEMFQGQVFWPSGRMAREALVAFLEHNGEQEHIPAMPSNLAELLQRCFRQDPAQRWQSFEELIQNLKRVYRAAVGPDYGRVLDKVDQSTVPPAVDRRRTRQGLSWRDPRDWLESALRAEGRDPDEAVKIMDRHASSHRGKLVADVAAYDEARRIYERLIETGREELAYELSILCVNAACVHETSGDFPGALALYDRCSELLERLIKVEGQHELLDNLPLVYEQKAKLLVNVGDNETAIGLYDRAIEIRERLANVEGECEITDGFATVYMNKAVALVNLGDIQAAITLYDQGIEILKRMIDAEGRHDLANDLATVYMNKANAFGVLGDIGAAVDLYDHAITICEPLANIEGQHELASKLAKLYMNKANIVDRSGDNLGAIILYDQSIEILERLITTDGRLELANDLAALYANKGIALREGGDARAAVTLYDRAIEIREWLTNMEGRSELASSLAKLYMNKANTLTNFGNNKAVIALYNQAIDILDRLVNIDGHRELSHELAIAYANKANTFMNLGDSRAAVAPYDQAIEILKQLVVDGRRELDGQLATLYSNKADAIRNVETTVTAS